MEDSTSTPKRKTMIGELIKGRDCTKKLQNLLCRRVVDGGPAASAEDLVTKIIGSFSVSLSAFGCWRTGGLRPAPETTCVEGAPVSKVRRGCYMRRNTEDSRVKLAYTYEDEYAWRKYGQKMILNAKFPRCYYRCTHKEEGCKASKQVQKLENGSELFHITYFGSHTCQTINKNTQTVSNLEDLSLCLINFKESRIGHSSSSPSTLSNIHKSRGFGVGENWDEIDFSGDMGEMEMRWRDDQDGEDGFAGSAYRLAGSGVGVPEFHISQIGIEQTERERDEYSVYPIASSFNQEDVANAQSGDYLASSSHGTTSSNVWEDMIRNLELSGGDLSTDDVNMDDFSFYSNVF